LAAKYDGPPPPRSWADRDPVAAARLSAARADLGTLAADLKLPVENLLTPDYVRRLMWEAPDADTEQELLDLVAVRLRDLGAREWQIELTAEPLAKAIVKGATATSDPADPADSPDSLDDVD
jgi:ribonuclease D